MRTGRRAAGRTSGGPAGNCRTPARLPRRPRPSAATPRCWPGRGTMTAAARQAVDAAIAEVDARTRQLRQAAAERRMPTADEQVDAIARAAAEFENAATAAARRAGQAGPGGRGPGRAGRDDRAPPAECAEADAAFDGARAAAAGPGRGVPHPGRGSAGRRPAGARADPADRAAHHRGRAGVPGAGRAGPRRARQGHRRGGRTAGQRQSLADAVGQLYEQAAQFGEYARPDLRALAGVDGRRALAGSGPLARPGPGRRGLAVSRPGRWPRRPSRRQIRPRPCAASFPRAWPGSSTRSPPPAAAGGRSPRARCGTPRTGCRSR